MALNWTLEEPTEVSTLDWNTPGELTKKYEGWRDTIYKDTTGNPTIAWGFNLNDPAISTMLPEEVKSGKRPITQEEAEPIFQKRYAQAEEDAKKFVGPNYASLDDSTKEVVTDMAYNLGYSRLIKFRKFREAIIKGDKNTAAEELKNSQWYNQTGNRAKEHYNRIKGLDLSFLNPLGATEVQAAEPTAQDFETNLQTQKDQQEINKRMQFLQQQIIEKEKQDPKNWTYEQTQKFFKDNPAQNPQEEATRELFLDQKKQARDSLVNQAKDTQKQQTTQIKEGIELQQKIIPEIRAANLRYKRPLNDQERAQAVVDLLRKEHGEEVPIGTKIERFVTSPEAQAISKAILLPHWTALEAIRGIMGAVEPSTSIKDMLIDSAKKGILEPEKVPTASESIMKAYPNIDWKVAGVVGTLAEIGVVAPGLYALLRKSLSKDTQYAQTLNAMRQTPQWQETVAKIAEKKNISIQEVDSQLARKMWEIRKDASYFKIINANLKRATGINILSEAGQAEIQRGAFKVGQEVIVRGQLGIIKELGNKNAMVQIGETLIRTLLSQIKPKTEEVKPEVTTPEIKPKVTVPKEPILAVKLTDGTVISDPDAKLHSDIITNKNINPNNVIDVGILDKEGNYQATKLPDEKGGKPLETLPEVPKEMIDKAKGLVNISDEELRQGMAKAGEQDLQVRKQELKSYLTGKLKPSLKNQGDYVDLEKLPWLWAKTDAEGVTPDTLTELSGMGFPVQNENDVLRLIETYFVDEIKQAWVKKTAQGETQYKVQQKQQITKPKKVINIDQVVLINKIKQIQKSKLLSNLTVSRIKKYFGIENIRKSGVAQLEKVAFYLDTLQEGDKLLSSNQLVALEKLIKDIPNVPIIPKRLVVEQIGEQENILEGLIVGKIPDEMLPTVDIKEGHPLIGSIVDKAELAMIGVEEETIRRDKQLDKMLTKAEQSRKRTFKEKVGQFIAPQNKEIFQALGGEIEMSALTHEERGVVAYLQNFFRKVKRDLELKKYREHYVTHLEKPLMEKIMSEGIMDAVKQIFNLRERDDIPINIMLELDNIIGSNKFFRYALPRRGYGKPTTNIRVIIHQYGQLYETKKALDQILPEGQAIVNILLPHRSAQWLKRYLQNLKGRGLDYNFRTGKMGWLSRVADGIVDIGYLKLLGLNYWSALKNLTAGEANSFIYQGLKEYLIGKQRMISNPKKTFKLALEHGVLEGTFAEYAEKGIGRLKKYQRIIMIGQQAGEWEIRGSLFCAMFTPEEWASGEISPEHIRKIKDVIAITQGIFSKTESPLFFQTWYGRLLLQMNRWRVTNAMAMRRFANGAKQEWQSGKKTGANSQRLARAFIIYGIGMYLAFDFAKRGYKKWGQVAQSMAEEVNSIIELVTMKPIVDALTANPTYTVLKEIAFTIQSVAAYIGVPGAQKPKAYTTQQGIEKTWIAPIERTKELMGVQTIKGRRKKGSSTLRW